MHSRRGDAPARGILSTGDQGRAPAIDDMFCDLVGSSALSVRFDPEDLREIIAVYHGAVSNTVEEA